ncbi:hypothetical protein LSH36_582g03030 [Paralvinella palmiformis]|uniref:EF-hand domain-containing protein n=1 Tax=Paralvinella palmiformis TaxID=53620 RepID=A0AAD9MVE0_9ANNE|nr:hypothetical protein LSH36_582g03030 [Paralvinella palmiformis]
MNSFSARVRSKFTSAELKAYRRHFDSFDLNGDGVISAKELGKVSDCVGYRMTKTDIKGIMRTLDLDSSGSLSFDEFLLAMPGNVNIPKEEHRAAEVRRMFMNYDRDGDGLVTVEEAHDVLRKELAFTVQQSIEIVRKYDKNGDGQLSYEEFISFYKEVNSKRQAIGCGYDTGRNSSSFSQSKRTPEAYKYKLEIHIHRLSVTRQNAFIGGHVDAGSCRLFKSPC